DFERAAERLDIAAQVAHIHVCPLFHLRDGRLSDMQVLSKIGLRLAARLTELAERHLAKHALGCFRVARPALRRHGLAKLVERAMSGHSNPSFRSSARYSS